MQDLTLGSFAYLRVPLLVAAIAFCMGAFATWEWAGQRGFAATALMMILFFHAARLAPGRLRSHPVVAAAGGGNPEIAGRNADCGPPLLQISSVFFYTNRTALLLNGRRINLEYGGYMLLAFPMYLSTISQQFKNLWLKPERCYIVASQNAVARP